jgi:type II secretory pathway pseudopilin PulG
MLKMRKNQVGDTIVEVLIAISVVSFVLVAAYIAANRNTRITQDVQERGQALQLATTQVEFLHSISLAGKNCFDTTGTPVGTAADNTPCMVKANGSKNTTHVQPEFTIAITNTSATQYQVQVTWTSLVRNGSQNSVSLYYQP